MSLNEHCWQATIAIFIYHRRGAGIDAAVFCHGGTGVVFGILLVMLIGAADMP